MRKVNIITDSTVKDYPAGAEMVDDTLSRYLDAEIIPTRFFDTINSDTTYIISNATMMKAHIKEQLINNHEYYIFEHDYKFHHTRQPHRFKDNIIPKDQLINIDYYKNAKCVFLQTKDHLECFNNNEIQGNFISLGTSLWSEEELSLLNHYRELYFQKDPRIVVIANQTADKGRDIALQWCYEWGIKPHTIATVSQKDFYNELGKYSSLVYFPRVKESFCRLVIEAKAMNLNVITKAYYGVTRENWYNDLNGEKLIAFLRTSTINNIQTIKNIIL